MELKIGELGLEGNLGVLSFVAARHPNETCGMNGLPLTPNSISILGRSQILIGLQHRNLTQFLDCVRGKHERVVLVSQYFTNDIIKEISGLHNHRDHENMNNDSIIPFPHSKILKYTRQTLEALHYLNLNDIVHVNLHPGNILIDDNNEVRLFNYALNHVTNYGQFVNFPTFRPRYVAPEVLWNRSQDESLSSSTLTTPSSEEYYPNTICSTPPKPKYSPQADVWSLGMILLRLYLKDDFWSGSKISVIIRKVMSFQDYEGDIVERIIRDSPSLGESYEEIIAKIPEEIQNLIFECLIPDPNMRPSPYQLLTTHKFDLEEIFRFEKSFIHKSQFPTLSLRCEQLIWPYKSKEIEEETPSDVLTISELYYLWRLAGGDVLNELRKHGLVVPKPPILATPKIVLSEGQSFGAPKERCTLYDPTVLKLNLTQLINCLSSLTIEDFYPLIKNRDDHNKYNSGQHGIIDFEETQSLPLVIRERDVKYQFSRIVLFRRLLQGYPFTRSTIWKEAKIDSLPLYRGYIWAALLDINYDVRSRYDEIDKESVTQTDRQIEVDIPRCHQYNNLLASPTGHGKFKRILKAWVATNQQYVYWQGLDSLCAPFLLLNFNDEALAFACLSAFIPKYLYGMFQKDNSAVIQEYLAKFSQIQAFHDAMLFNHLHGIGFIPDLYAIPWILTMFAHVFPLQNILHLWDKLLLGNSAFPLCVGLAILLQLRETLLNSEFNDCILLFSDLPAVDIEKCVKDSIHIFCSTPKSLTYRKYESPPPPSSPSNNKLDDSLHDELKINSITLAEIKRELVPRISGEELLTLIGMAPSKSESGYITGTKRVLIIDVRTSEEFKLGTLPGAINLPRNTSFTPVLEGSTPPPPSSLTAGDEPPPETLVSNRETEKLTKRGGTGGKLICIVGSRKNKHSIEFAEKLLKLNYNRICVLHIGIEIFKNGNNILIVPNT